MLIYNVTIRFLSMRSGVYVFFPWTWWTCDFLITKSMLWKWYCMTYKVKIESACTFALLTGTLSFRALSHHPLRSLTTLKSLCCQKWDHIERPFQVLWSAILICLPHQGTRHMSKWTFTWFQSQDVKSPIVFKSFKTETLIIMKQSKASTFHAFPKILSHQSCIINSYYFMSLNWEKNSYLIPGNEGLP